MGWRKRIRTQLFEMKKEGPGGFFVSGFVAESAVDSFEGEACEL